MKVLKSLALSLLGLLLFMSLSLFGLVFTLNQTILSRDFLAAEISKVDLAGIIRDTFGQQMGQQLGQQVSQQISQQLGKPVPPLNDVMTAALNSTVTELQPWAKQQLSNLAYNFQDYVMGRSSTLNLRIPLATAKDALSKNLRSGVLNASELAAVPQPLKEAAANSVAQSVTGSLPDTYDLSSMLGSGFTDGLRTVRQYSPYFMLAFWGLLVLIVLFTAGIFAVTSNLKLACRNVGTTFLTYGILDYAGALLASYSMNIPMGLPTSLQVWLSGFLADLSAPLKTFGIVVGAAGLLLLVASFVVKNPRKDTAPTGK